MGTTWITAVIFVVGSGVAWAQSPTGTIPSPLNTSLSVASATSPLASARLDVVPQDPALPRFDTSGENGIPSLFLEGLHQSGAGLDPLRDDVVSGKRQRADHERSVIFRVFNQEQAERNCHGGSGVWGTFTPEKPRTAGRRAGVSEQSG